MGPPLRVSSMTSAESAGNGGGGPTPSSTRWCLWAYISVSAACVSGAQPTALSCGGSCDLHSKQPAQPSHKVFPMTDGRVRGQWVTAAETPAKRTRRSPPTKKTCWGSVRVCGGAAANSPDNMLSLFMEENLRVISCLCRWIIRWSSVWNRCRVGIGVFFSRRKKGGPIRVFESYFKRCKILRLKDKCVKVSDN